MYVLPQMMPGAFGGIETYARELVSGMRGRGHEIDVVETNGDAVLQRLEFRDYWPPGPLRQRYFLWRREF